MHTKHKPNFILREFTSFMNKFEVVSLFRSSRKYLSNLSVCPGGGGGGGGTPLNLG